MGLSLTFLIEPVKANVCSFYYPRPLGEARNLRLVYEKLFGFNVISLYYLGIFVLFAWTFCVSTPSPSLFRLQNPRAVQDKRKSRDGGSTVCFWILLFFSISNSSPASFLLPFCCKCFGENDSTLSLEKNSGV